MNGNNTNAAQRPSVETYGVGAMRACQSMRELPDHSYIKQV